MIDSTVDNSGLNKIVSGLSLQNKQSPIAAKKTALRDVQNDNRSFLLKQGGGGSNADVVKLAGAKRFSPECNSVSPRLKLLKKSFINSHTGSLGNKLEFEQGKSKVQETAPSDTNINSLRTGKYPSETTELPQQQIRNMERNLSSPGGPSVTISQKKCNGNTPASISTHVVKQEVPSSDDIERDAEERRKERFFSLQKVLKYCDESDQRVLIQGLLKFSPSELSSYAFSLEKRSIQLSFEEANEIQRKQTLNILGKSSVTNIIR
ncbi:hypothetical protein ACFE04_014580 [Oxalis oulophora]